MATQCEIRLRRAAVGMLCIPAFLYTVLLPPDALKKISEKQICKVGW